MAVPKEVWAAAKALWESTPSITYQEVVDHLQEAYGDKAPASKSAVYNRAKKYDWQKLPILELKEKTKDSKKKQNKSEQNRIENKSKGKENNKAENEPENQVYRTIIDGTEKTKQKVVLSTEQRASVIIKHRKRLHNLGSLEDAIIMLSLDAAEQTLNQKPDEEHVSTDEDDDFTFYDDPDNDPIARKISVAKSLSGILFNLTSAQKTIAEQEMPMCGITPEDFAQSEQDRRLGALEALAGIDEEERAAREKLHEELKERMQMITQLEHDPDFFSGGDGGIEDADFDEVEEDE